MMNGILARGLCCLSHRTCNRNMVSETTATLGWLPVREVPLVFISDVERAEAATVRWYHQRDPGSLDKRVIAWERIYTHSDFDHFPLIFRVDVLNRLGISYMDRGVWLKSSKELDQAGKCWQKALALVPKDWPQKSNYLHNLGALEVARYIQSGEILHLNSSIDFYCLTLQDMSLASPNAGLYHNNLATSLCYRYERNGALADLECAIFHGEKGLALSLPGSQRCVLTLNNLGRFYRQRYLRTNSPEDVNRSVELHQLAVVETKNEKELPPRLSNLGNSLLDRYGLSKNIEDLEGAIDAQQRAVVSTLPEDPSLAIRLNNLGNCFSIRYGYSHQISDLNRAIEAYQQAIQLTPPTDPNLPSRLYNLANNLRDRFEYGSDTQDAEQAEQYYRKACGIGFDLSLEWSLGASKAWGYWAESRMAWEEAKEAFSFGLEAIDRLYRTQLLAESKATWLKEARELAGHAAYVLARLGELPQAVTTLEQNRTRALSDALTYQDAILRAVSDGDRNSLMLAHQRIKDLELEAGVIGQPGVRDFPTLSADLHQAHEDLGSVVTRIRNYLTDFMAEGLDFQEILSLADSLNQPLVYLITSIHGSLALIIARTSINSVSSLPEEVESLWLDEFRLNTLDYILYDDDKSHRYLHGTVLGEVETLYAVLDDIWPVIREDLMQQLVLRLHELGYHKAVIVPVGTLSLLPLHAVVIDEVTFTYSPSARSLKSILRCQDHAGLSPSFLGIGNSSSSQLPPLVFARLEVEKISTTFASLNLNHTTLYEGEARLEDVIKKLPGITHLHLACHGRFDNTNPLQSALFLAGEDTLSLSDILRGGFDISSVRLAVLSACQSGVTEFWDKPDEAVGFPAGFIQAGVPGVVSTLWPVNDVSTAILLNRFYQLHLGKNEAGQCTTPKGPASALYSAQQWLRDTTAEDMDLVRYYEHTYRESGRRDVNALQWMRYYSTNLKMKPFSHPYYWAGFIFSGT